MLFQTELHQPHTRKKKVRRRIKKKNLLIEFNRFDKKEERKVSKSGRYKNID